MNKRNYWLWFCLALAVLGLLYWLFLRYNKPVTLTIYSPDPKPTPSPTPTTTPVPAPTSVPGQRFVHELKAVNVGIFSKDVHGIAAVKGVTLLDQDNLLASADISINPTTQTVTLLSNSAISGTIIIY